MDGCEWVYGWGLVTHTPTHSHTSTLTHIHTHTPTHLALPSDPGRIRALHCELPSYDVDALHGEERERLVPPISGVVVVVGGVVGVLIMAIIATGCRAARTADRRASRTAGARGGISERLVGVEVEAGVAGNRRRKVAVWVSGWGGWVSAKTTAGKIRFITSVGR